MEKWTSKLAGSLILAMMLATSVSLLAHHSFGGTYDVARQITIKGKLDPFVLDVAVTRHGPILTPVLEGQKAQLALRWTGLEGTKTLDAILGMQRARSFDEFRRAAADPSPKALGLKVGTFASASTSPPLPRLTA